MGSKSSGRGWGFVALVLGCTPDSEQVGQVDETSDGTAGSSGTDGPASATMQDDGDDDASDDGPTEAGDEVDEAADDETDFGDEAACSDESTTAAVDPCSAEDTGEQCVEEDWPACQVEACVQAWSFACDACPEEQSHPLCFGVSEGCEFPWLDCAALPDSSCGRVWGEGEDAIVSFEDEDAALCLLGALRDGVPGTYNIVFGVQFDFGPANVEVLVGADRSAVMQWDYECMNCFGGGDNGRSGTMALQPASYFDDCLAAPTTDSLIQCIFGFVEIPADGLPPKGWTPPFTTGECSALEFACPPA